MTWTAASTDHSSAACLPNFICIGAQKAGTSWLYEQLRVHSGVFMPMRELNFFYRRLEVGWYTAQYADSNGGSVSGDISPNYSAFIGLASRISAICPLARIILIIRDPVERAFSQYKMAKLLGNIPADMSFIQAFRENCQYMQRRGRYIEIIREYERFYPLGDRMALFHFDDIATRPLGLIEEISHFLEITPQIDHDLAHQQIGRAQNPERIGSQEAREVAAYYRPFNFALAPILDRRPAWLDR